MNADDTTPPKPVRLSTLHRRAEKGWRFRDIERSWTHFVWMLLITGQTMLLGIFAIAVTIKQNSVSDVVVGIVCVLTCIELTGLFILSRTRRNIDARRAAHFEASVRAGEQREHYDNSGPDRQYEKEDFCWRNTSEYAELAASIIFIATMVMLFLSIVIHHKTP